MHALEGFVPAALHTVFFCMLKQSLRSLVERQVDCTRVDWMGMRRREAHAQGRYSVCHTRLACAVHHVSPLDETRALTSTHGTGVICGMRRASHKARVRTFD
eukprot:6176590-Pleurochrysis_carterae.AAC.1